MLEVKFCEKSRLYYLLYYVNGKKVVLDKSISRKWINEQYCRILGNCKEVYLPK